MGRVRLGRRNSEEGVGLLCGTLATEWSPIAMMVLELPPLGRPRLTVVVVATTAAYYCFGMLRAWQDLSQGRKRERKGNIWLQGIRGAEFPSEVER